VTAVLGVLALSCGCTNQVVHDPSTTQAAAPINRTFPILREKVDPNVTVRYKGQIIGFCCSECVDDWARMGDDLKDERLRNSM